MAIKEILGYNKILALVFQVLFNHCSSVERKGRDEVMTEFFPGCPT